MSEQDRIPAGRYVGRCTGPADVKYGVAEGGAEQVGFLVRLLNEGYEQETVACYVTFSTEKSTQFAIRTLRDLGWQGTDVTDLRGIDQNDVDVLVKYETFDNKRRMKVSVFAPGGAVQMKTEMNDAQKRAFAQKIKGAAMAAQRTNGGGGGGSAQRPPPNFGGQTAKQQSADDFGAYGGGSDDDVPFVSSRPGRWGV